MYCAPQMWVDMGEANAHTCAQLNFIVLSVMRGPRQVFRGFAQLHTCTRSPMLVQSPPLIFLVVKFQDTRMLQNVQLHIKMASCKGSPQGGILEQNSQSFGHPTLLSLNFADLVTYRSQDTQ
jgi:hypothetical protein